MTTTRFWLIRHAIVEENARAVFYGCMDVMLCPDALMGEAPRFSALAARLPRGALWITSPLSRTRGTAEAIQRAGYPATPLDVEPDFTEQDLGEWQGLPHAELPPLLTRPAHPFWPLDADERPPGGESMQDVVARVGTLLDRLAADHPGRDIVVVSHGGTIRAALAHALGVSAQTTLHCAVQNLSLTCLQREEAGWRVICVNEHDRLGPEYVARRDPVGKGSGP